MGIIGRPGNVNGMYNDLSSITYRLIAYIFIQEKDLNATNDNEPDEKKILPRYVCKSIAAFFFLLCFVQRWIIVRV